MERLYEVALMKRVPNSVYDDFESVEFIEADNYHDAETKAKKYSKKWDACDVICYIRHDNIEYDQLYRKTFIDGKYYRMIVFA